jgi:hypothetical protein
MKDPAESASFPEENFLITCLSMIHSSDSNTFLTLPCNEDRRMLEAPLQMLDRVSAEAEVPEILTHFPPGKY